MSEETLALEGNETTNKENEKEQKPKVVSARNPENRVYVVQFDADGYLCKKEINETHLTHTRSKARIFRSNAKAEQAMKEFCEYNSHIKIEDGVAMMFVRANSTF